MASKILSVFLGSGTAKLAEIAYSGKKVQVFSVYDIVLSEGLCDDGIIYDVEGLARELKQYISTLKIKTKKIVFSVASKRIASKEIFIPFVKEKQIADLLKANAQDYFPIGNLDEYSFCHSILEVVQSEDNKQYRLSVIAVPNEILANYVELADRLKLEIETIDYAGNAILQILESQAKAAEVSAILQLGRESTVINIFNGKTLIMQRSISYGLDALISAVKDAVRMDDEDALAFLEDNDITRISEAYSDVAEVVSLIVNGVGRIFDFYTQRNSQNPIANVLFLGDGTLINGIGQELYQNFGINTEEILSLKNVVVKNKALNDNDPTNFLANVGAVIAPMNLKYISKDDSDKKAKDDTKMPWGLVVISVVAAAALAGSTIFMYYNANNQRDDLKRQLASLEEVRGLETQLSDAEYKSNIVKDFLNSTKGPNDSLYRLITDLEKVMPQGMSIDSLSLSDGSFSLSGGGIGKQGVAKFIEEVKALKYVQNVNIDYVSEVIDGVDAYDSFTMTFSLLDVNAIEEQETSEVESQEEIIDNSQEEIVDNNQEVTGSIEDMPEVVNEVNNEESEVEQ